jgi:murein DD-endopeptidase MepM/ murein hydrolase activator NlpD
MRRLASAAFASLAALLAFGAAASAQDVVRRVGQVTFLVDTSLGLPGGILRARLQSRGLLGTAWAILDGRKFPFYASSRGPRAFVPIPVTTVAGPNTLGVEIMGRRGRQRIPIPVTIAERPPYAPRTVVIPEEKRPLLKVPSVTRDGRLLLSLVRTESPRLLAAGPFQPPAGAAPGTGFGGLQTYVGGSPVESMIDGTFGEQHRGLDYEVSVGTVVQSPAAGTVVFVGPLTLSGETVVIDHGQGVVSALFHLSRIDVRAGDAVAAGGPLGLSGDSGLAVTPGVQWRLYVHGIAVDPRLVGRGLE